MKKFFDIKALKSSEVCDKYSTSVSYETLVGGTTTTGREYEQNKWLSKGSADKPLSAVGTLTSLLCNSAKVMEKLLRHVITRRTSVRRGYLPEQGTHANEESLFASVTCFMKLPRRIQRMLLVMTIPTLAFALIFSLNISPSFAAEDLAPTSGTCNNAGTCLWSLDESGKLSITSAMNPATGKPYENVVMDNYEYKGMEVSPNNWEDWSTAPWSGSYQNTLRIKEVYVGDGITNIGNEAFDYAENLTSVSGMNDVKTIGDCAFSGASSLTNVDMPNVEEIGAMAFGSTSLSGIDLPNLKKVGDLAFSDTNIQYVNLPDDVEYCDPDCGKSLYEEGNFYYGIFSGDVPVAKLYKNDKCTTSGGKVTCGSCGNDYAMSGKGCVKDCGAGMLGKNGKCVSTSEGCGENYKNMGGWCNRIRYTTAEAAKVLTDDNNNSVTITFKK